MPVPTGTIRAGIETIHILGALIHAVTNTVNSKKSREQQEKLAEENRQLAKEMEEMRQNFTASQNEENTRRQKELSLLNHKLRMEEQKINFEIACKQAEWNVFMNRWPLVNPPSVIREEQILPDNTVSLRIIFSKSSDQNFAQVVYPRIELGLREFVDLYHNVFGSRNIIFYHNAFVSNMTGGAVDANIHYALRELPVIIIDTNILMDEIIVSFTMWGLGSTYQEHFTVFKMPYQAQKDLDYYKDISKKILAYLKFVLGYAYDAYNLIEYNRMPLLPKVAHYELENGYDNSMLNVEELRLMMADKYREIYYSLIGMKKPDSKTIPYALLPESTKKTILHELRLKYAESVCSCISDEEYVNCLDESLEAWVELRSLQPVDIFLSDLIKRFDSKDKEVLKFFSDTDREYLNQLEKAYNQTHSESGYRRYIGEIVKGLRDVLLDEPPNVRKASSSGGSKTGGSANKMIKF